MNDSKGLIQKISDIESLIQKIAIFGIICLFIGAFAVDPLHKMTSGYFLVGIGTGLCFSVLAVKKSLEGK